MSKMSSQELKVTQLVYQAANDNCPEAALAAARLRVGCGMVVVRPVVNCVRCGHPIREGEPWAREVWGGLFHTDCTAEDL
jgi:hypothetical protein